MGPIKITQLDILKAPPSWVRAVSLYCKQSALASRSTRRAWRRSLSDPVASDAARNIDHLAAERME